MSLRRSILTAVAPLALIVLGGCVAQPFRADVSRFQMMPAPQGQSFYIQAEDPALQGGLEFSQYASIVAARLAQQGYQPAASPRGATLIVSLDYGVDNGHEKVVSTPGFGPGFGGYGGFGPWGYGGFGRGYGRGGFSYGWNDPFWYQGFGGYNDVSSYTYYVSNLDMRIRRSADGQVLFEGRARARSLDDSLPHIVPNLIDAMFTGFPGRSGEDVLITLPPPPKAG